MEELKVDVLIQNCKDKVQYINEFMRDNGIHVVDSPAEIGKKVKEVLG